MLNLIADREYQLLLNMEDERIRLGGRLVLLFFNTYIINKVLQEKTRTLSEPHEIFGRFIYSDGYNVEEGESGKKTEIDATVRFSKMSLDSSDNELKIGDVVNVNMGGDDYQEFTILNIKPIVTEKEYLDRIISYECELKFVSSRKIKNER